jgi:DNA-binding LacI/PurR family transcriptional regulator
MGFEGLSIVRGSMVSASTQLADYLRGKIEANELKAGERLPTTSQMVKSLGVGATTVNTAINQLVREGLVESTPGRGTFIKDKKKSTRSVAVLFPDPRLNTALSSRLLHGLAEAMDRNSLRMVLNQLAEGHLPPNFSSQEVEGVIVRPGDYSLTVAKQPITGIPAVWLFEQPWGVLPDSVDNVLPDTDRFAELAVDYLVRQRGHRRVAVVNHTPNHFASVRRGLVFREIASSIGASVDVLVDDGSSRSGIENLMTRLMELSPRPTGILLPLKFDVVLYQVMIERGIEPCRDIDVVAGSERPEPIPFAPHVPIIDVPFELLGKWAVELLLWRLANPKEPRRRVLVEPVLREGVRQ